MEFYEENNLISLQQNHQSKKDNNSDYVNCKELQEQKFIGVLSEDHPLLEKFQQSLNEHLIRIQTQLNEDIYELNIKIKDKEKEKEDIGSKLYDLQQEIHQQNYITDDFSKQIKICYEKRILKENDIKILQKQYNDSMILYKEIKIEHKNRLIELTNLQILEINIQKWSAEIENKLIEAQCIVNKDNHDQKLITNEKQKTDMLLFNLNSEIRKKEQELQMIIEQINEQNNLLQIFHKNLINANTDLEILQKEQKRLTQSWNEVILAINKRDQILIQVKDNLM